MNELALYGKIEKIFDEQQISETFVKREFENESCLFKISSILKCQY